MVLMGCFRDITSRSMPLTCHGHSRPVTHLNYSEQIQDGYYLISACKDGNPMLRDGITGDWIGTFMGHKGAVWSSKLSPDAEFAATGSGDFSAKIWDPDTGECLHTLAHNHIVKAVAFPLQRKPQIVATGGQEKKLRIFDLSRASTTPTPLAAPFNGPTPAANGSSPEGFEIGVGDHTASIKSIVWNVDYNILTTAADDKTIRWYDLRTQNAIATLVTTEDITSCELSTNSSTSPNPGVLSVAAGHSAYFFAAGRPGEVFRHMKFDAPIASVAANMSTGRYVTGGLKDTWLRTYDFASERLLEIQKGHHGPIWSIMFSPDDKIVATGSEDGTVKLWKACEGDFGLWKAGANG